MDGTAYLDSSRSEFEKLRRLAEGALEQVDEADLLREPAPGVNSIALVMKHLSGNMRSRWTDFLTTDGEKPDRDRDSEFRLEPGDTPAALRERWLVGWTCLFDALARLGEQDMGRIVTIRGEPHTVVQAIQRQIAHYGHHVGQIVLLARMACGPRWRSLSIPRGESERYNRESRTRFGGGS